MKTKTHVKAGVSATVIVTTGVSATVIVT